jgi:hypothetical protein
LGVLWSWPRTLLCSVPCFRGLSDSYRVIDQLLTSFLAVGSITGFLDNFGLGTFSIRQHMTHGKKVASPYRVVSSPQLAVLAGFRAYTGYLANSSSDPNIGM